MIGPKDCWLEPKKSVFYPFFFFDHVRAVGFTAVPACELWNIVSCHLQIRTHLRNLVLFFYSCLNFSKLKMIMSCLEGRKQINKIKIKQLMEAKQIVGSEIMCLQLVISMESTGFHVSTFCCLSSLHISSSLNSPLCFFIYCFPFLSFIE